MRTSLTPGVILTYTGISFTPHAPRSEDIRITDIAHALAHQCRFTGHTSHFYSVAQHSLRVSYMVDAEHALWGLLHDATEAYLSDIALPLKMLPEYDGYRAREKILSDTIMRTFGLPEAEPPEVKAADREICKQEGVALMQEWTEMPDNEFFTPFRLMLPEEAKRAFINRFHQLY